MLLTSFIGCFYILKGANGNLNVNIQLPEQDIGFQEIIYVLDSELLRWCLVLPSKYNMFNHLQGILVVLLLQKHLDPTYPDVKVVLNELVIDRRGLVEDLIALPKLPHLLINS